MSEKRLHTKRTTLHFVVGNEQRFPLLLGTNNTLRIFMVLSEIKSTLVIKISQRYCLLTVWNSYLFNICFLGRLDFFCFGRHNWNFGQHDSGFGRDDSRATWPVTLSREGDCIQSEVYYTYWLFYNFFFHRIFNWAGLEYYRSIVSLI